MTLSGREELELAERRFGVVDYVVFVLMLLVCAVVGGYYGFIAKMKTAEDYLVGGRNMKLFPISMSLIATFLSSTALIGVPTDVYLNGMQYFYNFFGIILMAAVLNYAYLPVLHDLKLTSTYEYLELRFSKQARLFGSVLFCIKMIVAIPIYLYAPALAFSQVSGVPIHTVAFLICFVCVFYTCLGGVKAVVWTDVIQVFSMYGAVLLLAVKGTSDLGGIAVVWERNIDGGRLEPPILNPDPTVRYTLWSSSIGIFCILLQTHAFNQSMMQRYLCLRHLQSAKSAAWIFVFGAICFLILSFYCGLVTYATYHDCDPLSTKVVEAKDQVVLLLVMRTLGAFPGLPGIFLAGACSAALSSLSSSLNSMAAVVLEDFYKAFCTRPLTERHKTLLMKAVVVVMGLLGVSLVFVIEKLGSVLQMALSIGSIPEGPILAVFSMGLFLPWINTKGMLVGGSCGLIFVSWITSGAYMAVTSGELAPRYKPLTTDGCSYSFNISNLITNNMTSIPSSSKILFLYRLSYMWYVPLGCFVSILVALVVSFLTGANDIRSIDTKLLSPAIRRFIPKKDSKLNTMEEKPLVEQKNIQLQIMPKRDSNMPLNVRK